jgi:Histidine kinase
MGVEYPRLQTIVEILTALASVGTAVAFAVVLPQMKMLPSPRQQREDLLRLVAERTREKDRLIREINHRIGNQIQVLKSIVSVENRKATEPESITILARIQEQLDTMAAQYTERSQADYLEAGVS